MMKDARGRSSPEAAASGVHLWLVLWRAARTLELHARRSIAGMGMCPSDFGVLEALLHKGPQAVNRLGAKVLLTSGSITTAVDRLERLGCVTRHNDPKDRRARVVHLTAEGRRLIRKAFAEHQETLDQATSALTAAERAALIGLLRRLGHGAEQLSRK